MERISLTRYKKLYPMFIPNFKNLGTVVPEKSLTKNFIGENIGQNSRYCHGIVR